MTVSFATMAGLVGVKPATPRQLRVIRNTDPEPQAQQPPRGAEIRPDTFDELIGQEEAIVQILTVLEASEEDKEPAYPHMLLDGPSGVGKTTLCLAIAKRRGTELHIYAPSSLRRADDVRSMLLKINKGDVVLIDEIHGLRPAIEESIYPALEGLPVPVSEGNGRNRQTTTIKLPPCTFVGGTTSTGGLAEPLRNRFAVQITLRRYTDDEISRILRCWPGGPRGSPPTSS
jgi:Holliday junction DNA helicase RuvB